VAAAVTVGNAADGAAAGSAAVGTPAVDRSVGTVNVDQGVRSFAPTGDEPALARITAPADAPRTHSAGVGCS
jgi:hypothetical protein